MRLRQTLEGGWLGRDYRPGHLTTTEVFADDQLRKDTGEIFNLSERKGSEVMLKLAERNARRATVARLRKVMKHD